MLNLAITDPVAVASANRTVLSGPSAASVTFQSRLPFHSRNASATFCVSATDSFRSACGVSSENVPGSANARLDGRDAARPVFANPASAAPQHPPPGQAGTGCANATGTVATIAARPKARQQHAGISITSS